MNGQKGLAIAITALLLTVCIGYLFNAEETTASAIVYKDQADMGALFYENSSRVSGSEIYNAPINVSGWTPTELMDTVSTPNQYIISKGTISYNADATTTKTFNNSGKSYTTTTAISGGNWYYKTNTTATYAGGNTLNNGESLHGGISEPNAGNLKLDYQLNGTSTTAGNYLLFIPVGEIWSYSNQDYLYLNNGTNYYYDCAYTVNGAFFSGGITVNFTGTAINNSWHHAIYNNITTKWDVYNSNDGKEDTVENLYIVSTDPTASFTVKYKTYAGSSNATYADPTKLCNMAQPGTTLYWNADNETQQYTSITLLMKYDSTNQNIGIYAPDDSLLAIILKLSNDTLQIWGETTNKIGNYSAYDGVQVTIDFKNKTYTATGVLNFDNESPRTNYTLAGVTYNGELYAGAPDYVHYLKFEAANVANSTYDSKIAIVNTEIITDPRGVLWNNFNLDVNDYFPSYINSNSNKGVRVQLGGFVKYGDSLTVNGQTFAVTDGKINVGLTDGLTIQNRDMPLSGMAIDYRDNGNAYLVFTENHNRECDLGAIADYVIAGAGSWYFSATFDTIEQTTTQVWEWVTDWSLDTNATCALYLALTIAGLVIGLYYGRGAFGLYDWVVLILADVIAFSLMVV